MSGQPARVAFVGNVANSHYRAVTALRAEGVDAHLFASSSDPVAGRPEQEDPQLAHQRPPWLHVGEWITATSVLMPWRAPLTRALSDFDCIVASGPGPIHAQFAGRPWSFFVTGGDLTVKPFPFTFWRWYPTWAHRGAEVVAGAWQRRAARRADQVWLQRFAPMVEAADRLGIADSARSDRYVPIVIDPDDFSDDIVDPEADAWADAAVGSADFVVFHPSRMVMSPDPDLVRTGQWKGNDVLVRGFAQHVRSTGDVGAVLALPDVQLSRERDAARELIRSLDIEPQVRWVTAPGGAASIDRRHMAALYRRAAVVADDFGVGWFGYVTLEGLASSRPVLCHVDAEVMASMYPDHPILDTADADQVCAALTRLRSDPAWRAELGLQGRSFVERHHSRGGVASTYRAALEDLVQLGSPALSTVD